MNEDNELPGSYFQSFRSSYPRLSWASTQSGIDLIFILKISHLIDTMSQWTFLSCSEKIVRLKSCIPDIFAESFRLCRKRIKRYIRGVVNGPVEFNQNSIGHEDNNKNDDDDDENYDDKDDRKLNISVFIDVFDQFLKSNRESLVKNQIFPLGKINIAVDWNWSSSSSSSVKLRNRQNDDMKGNDIEKLEIDFDQIVIEMKNRLVPVDTDTDRLNQNSPLHVLRSELCCLSLFRNPSDSALFELMSNQCPEYLTSFNMHSAIEEFLTIVEKASLPPAFQPDFVGRRNNSQANNTTDCSARATTTAAATSDKMSSTEAVNLNNPLSAAFVQMSSFISQEQGNDAEHTSQKNAIFELLSNHSIFSSIAKANSSTENGEEGNEIVSENPVQKIVHTIQNLLSVHNSLSNADRDTAFEKVSQILNRLRVNGILSFYEKFFKMIKSSISGGEKSEECDVIHDICVSIEKGIELLMFSSSSIDIGISRSELNHSKKIVREIQDVQQIVKKYDWLAVGEGGPSVENNLMDQETRNLVLAKAFHILKMLMLFNTATAKILSDFGWAVPEKKRLIDDSDMDTDDDDGLDPENWNLDGSVPNPLEFLSLFTDPSSQQSEMLLKIANTLKTINSFGSTFDDLKFIFEDGMD